MPSGCTIAEAIVLSRRKAPSSIGWGQPRSRRFSPNGRYVHYLRESTGSVRELWRADIESGRNEPVLPGIAIVSYVSIVFDQRSESGKPLTRNKL